MLTHYSCFSLAAEFPELRKCIVYSAFSGVMMNSLYSFYWFLKENVFSVDVYQSLTR